MVPVHEFELVVRVARLALESSGEGVEMLERSVARAAASYGVDVDLVILPEQVLLTDRASGEVSHVAVVRATPGIFRLDQVAAVKRLLVRMEQGLDPAEAGRLLDAVETSRPRWPGWARVLGVALFAAGFAPSVVATWSEVRRSDPPGAPHGSAGRRRGRTALRGTPPVLRPVPADRAGRDRDVGSRRAHGRDPDGAAGPVHRGAGRHPVRGCRRAAAGAPHRRGRSARLRVLQPRSDRGRRRRRDRGDRARRGARRDAASAGASLRRQPPRLGGVQPRAGAGVQRRTGRAALAGPQRDRHVPAPAGRHPARRRRGRHARRRRCAGCLRQPGQRPPPETAAAGPAARRVLRAHRGRHGPARRDGAARWRRRDRSAAPG